MFGLLAPQEAFTPLKETEDRRLFLEYKDNLHVLLMQDKARQEKTSQTKNGPIMDQKWTKN